MNMPTYYNQPFSQPYIPTKQPNNINWVQGIEGAKAFQLLPNSNVVLLDSENEKFYIKSCDNIGMCTLRTFNYIEETDKPKDDYVTRSELDEVIKKYEQLVSRNGQQNNSKSIQQSTGPANNENGKR